LTAEHLQERTKKFSLQIIFLFRTLPKTTDAQVIGRQLLRAATSVAANYRAACRARSKAEFVAKLSIVVEEADEVMLWLELLEEADIVVGEQMRMLHQEAKELLYIFSAPRKTAKDAINQSKNNPLNK